MYRFTIKGHKNTLATHPTTIEFTKEKEVTLNGDCIAGVDATFDVAALLREFAYPKVEIKMVQKGEHFTFYATPNKQFNDDNELVFRKTDFLSTRTAGIYATRAAADIPKKMRQALQREEHVHVSVKGVPIQYIFFDFDDTLCNFFEARTFCHKTISQDLTKRYNLPSQRFKELLDTADLQFPKQASAKNDVLLFDRHKWFPWIMQKMGKAMTPKECNEWVKHYWDCMISHSFPLPGAASTLAILKKKYRLGLLTDADGKKEYKKARIAHSGLSGFFDASVLGDELHVVKPHPSMFHALLHAFEAKPEQCVMIGDKPWGDLLPAKKLGMITVWMKHGIYAKQVTEIPPYVDYVITEIKQLQQLF